MVRCGLWKPLGYPFPSGFVGLLVASQVLVMLLSPFCLAGRKHTTLPRRPPTQIAPLGPHQPNTIHTALCMPKNPCQNDEKREEKGKHTLEEGKTLFAVCSACHATSVKRLGSNPAPRDSTASLNPRATKAAIPPFPLFFFL